jgi:outer membrane lipoprotein carrier protein
MRDAARLGKQPRVGSGYRPRLRRVALQLLIPDRVQVRSAISAILGGFWFILCFFALQPSASAQTLTVQQLLQRVDSRYNHLKTLEAQFVEVYTAGLQQRTQSGVLYLSKPGKMRWNYEVPQRKLFLVDGHNIWVYVAGDNQAEKTSVKNAEDLRTPLRFLLGHADLTTELANQSYGSLNPLQPGDVVVHGVPRHLADEFTDVAFEVTPADLIVRFVLRGVNGSENDIRLSHIALNPPLPKGLFHFAPPPGVQVVAGSIGSSSP